MKKAEKRAIALGLVLSIPVALLSGCAGNTRPVLTLKVSNWEEYIDLGGWEEDEVIDLSEEEQIIGRQSLVREFEEWYYVTRGKRIKVEYSTFGTNEDLYNQITLGDVYDLVCPSEYMIMKLLHEGRLEKFDDSFWDESGYENAYAKGVSPFIKETFEKLDIDGEKLSDYTAGYMWGTLGLVYNPELVDEEDVKHWNILLNEKYKRRITIKDSVRDTYFAALAIMYYDELMGGAVRDHDRLTQILNRRDPQTIEGAQDVITRARENVYSFETDAGKADLVTGKVAASMQWSGDGVFTMEQALDDDIHLRYSIPEEGTNLWFDGWVMMKDGVEGNPEKKDAAQAFVNFISRPENAIRNMYYIGYTSVISGGDSDLILDYADWCSGAEDDAEVTEDYPLGYFFGGDDEDYCVTIDPETTEGMILKTQYPSREEMDRAAVMDFFDNDCNEQMNRMWTNVRCFDLRSLFGKK